MYSAYPAEVRERLLKCFGSSETQGKQKDARMDALRQEVLRAILPTGRTGEIPKDKLSQMACVLTMAPTDETNEIVKRKATAMGCIQKELQTKGVDAANLDMKSIQMKCLRCAFPNMNDVEVMQRYKEVALKFEEMEANALRINSELEAAMRYTLDDGPTAEMNAVARTACMAKMFPGVKVNSYLDLVKSLMGKKDLNTKRKIDVCTYQNSLLGKWVRARQEMIRDCALEAQKTLPANLKNDVNFLYALHLNNTALEVYMSCAANEEDTIVDGPTKPGGYVDVYCTSNGRAPKKCPQCAFDSYTTVDAAKVESTVDACYSKKEKTHPLFREYSGYVAKVEQRRDAIQKCTSAIVGKLRDASTKTEAGTAKISGAGSNPSRARTTKG